MCCWVNLESVGVDRFAECGRALVVWGLLDAWGSFGG